MFFRRRGWNAMKITGSGEIEEVVKGKIYRIRHHLGHQHCDDYR